MSQRLFYHIIVLIISPVWSLYLALQTRKRKLMRWVLIFFITAYGSIINFSESADGIRHQQRVEEHFLGMSIDQFLKELLSIIRLEPGVETSDDPYIHILSYVSGGILHWPGLFFTMVAFVYGYFFIGSLFRLFRLFPDYKREFLFFMLAIVFIFHKNIEGINTVRTWTGLWVLFYSVLSYYQTRNKKYFVLAFIPPLIHVGYLVLAVPAWIVLLFGNRPKIYTGIFFLSFFAQLLPVASSLSFLQTSAVGQEKVHAYHVENEEELLAREGQGSGTWYRQAQQAGIHLWAYSFMAAALILLGFYGRQQLTQVEISLFSVGILTKALSNSTEFLYAVTNRSEVIAVTFVLAPLILMWQRGFFNSRANRVIILKSIVFIAVLGMLPHLIYQFAALIQFVSVYIFAFPIIPWIMDSLNMSIREALGEILRL